MYSSRNSMVTYLYYFSKSGTVVPQGIKIIQFVRFNYKGKGG